MSFFLKEGFHLDGAFQAGIDTETAGNGVVYQENNYCYLETGNDAGGAVIKSAESLTAAEFLKTPLKITYGYELLSLNDGDSLHFMFSFAENQTGIDNYNTRILQLWVTRSGANYYERWVFWNSGGTAYYWEGGVGWNAAIKSVRSISLATPYTLEIVWHPDTQTFTFTNDNGDTATTTAILSPTDNVWWMIGDVLTGNYYGQLKLDYIEVIDRSVSDEWILRNSLVTDTAFVNNFDGSFSIFRNSLLEGVSEEWTFKNDLLEYGPVKQEWTLRNNIGSQPPTCFTPETNIYLDGKDITGKVESWEIAYESYTKTLKIELREKDFLKDKGPLRPGEDGFDETRIEVVVNGDSLGNFYWESAGEQVSDGYGADIEGRSYTAYLDRPYTENINTLYTEDVLKKTLIESLASPINVIYNIIDTTIPGNTYSVKDKSRIAIVKEIAEAGGGDVFTDADDNLIIGYKKETDPVLSLDSGMIIDPTNSMIIPTRENEVEVTGYSDEEDSGLWPYIMLTASKYLLESNGVDSLLLTAYCYRPGRIPEDTEVVEHESANPSDPHKISVSKTIKKVTGVRKDEGGSPGNKIAGPYTFEGSQITTTGEMLDLPHLVSYEGGETCSFSAEGGGSLDDSEVLIENARAVNTLRASAGGGGEITVTATYRGMEAICVITLDDPMIDGISASAKDSDLATGDKTTITARAWDPHGSSVPDGTIIYFEVFEGTGALSASSAPTTTSEITEEVTSQNQVTLSVNHEIDSLTSIYRLVDGEPYTGVNYADYVKEISGNTITLNQVLSDKVQSKCQVIYESGGTAQVEFTAPATGSEVNCIRCSVGAEDCIVEINVNIESSGSTASTTGTGMTGPWQPLTFSGSFTGREGHETYEDIKRIVKKDGYSIEVKTDEAVISDGAEYIQGIRVVNSLASLYTLVICTVVAKKDDIAILRYNPLTGETQGYGDVYDKDTGEKIPGLTVYINWAGDGNFTLGNYDFAKAGYEKCVTGQKDSKENMGKFFFYKGILDQDVVFYFKGSARVGGALKSYDEKAIKRLTMPAAGAVDGSVYRYYEVAYNATVKYRYKSNKLRTTSAI